MMFRGFSSYYKSIDYQIDTRFSAGKNIGSASVILNASYHAPI